MMGCIKSMDSFAFAVSDRLIEECWSTDPSARPNFADIITRLTTIQSTLGGTSCFRAITLRYLQRTSEK